MNLSGVQERNPLPKNPKTETNKFGQFVRKNIVMLIAAAAAAVSAFFVKPDGAYIAYFDFKTLTCLFCVLAVVCALKNISFFEILACKIVEKCKNTRTSILVLVYVTFIGSMLIANDMALLTFLPLGYSTLYKTGKEKYMAFTFIMQNIAANLGGMLTPFGNPQNLYLYSKFGISNAEFVSIMFPPFLLSVILITICCLFIKPEPIRIGGEIKKLDPAKSMIYFVLFAFSIALVFKIIPYYFGLILIPAVLLFMDKKALAAVDYPLLLTFAAFFVFSGNLSRIEAVRNLFAGLLEKNTLLFSALSCQFISNVPTAVLLSNFTSDYAGLLVGVNIGGVGTIIASLASLITLREYTNLYPGKQGSYILKFSAFNFGFLAVLLVFCLLIL
ncbi:MAG TPA: SLC13 family permease [Oscillospiraceae bacterium]|nr:SLC13 family permease [Oscillospiraceae bacterium]HPF55746.1 SLC13 family permease [Clostridiales bacterium]HPK34257.1 SLC13 family permease [Oscillospiraceae bacterium]HPR74840.1 SLC13 family permease [Oscillospiraceae bacterium]